MTDSEHERIGQKVADALRGLPATLTLEIRPTENDDEHVRFSSFIGQLEAFKEVLRHTERLIYGSEGNVYYRIAQLKQESPPQVTLEAVAATPKTGDFGPAIFESVLERLDNLSAAGPDWVPGDMDLPALLAYQAFAPTSKRHISELVVRNGKGAITLDEDFSRQVRTAIGPDAFSRGEIVGSLEVVNLHTRPRFEVYPTLGARVTCRFPQEMRRNVIAALDRYVRVTGRMHYKRWSPNPHAVDLESIEVLPTEDEISPFESLRGIAPELLEELDHGFW